MAKGNVPLFQSVLLFFIILTSSAILDLINMYFGSSMTIIYQENDRKCKIRQFISRLCNVFLISNVSKSLWNGTLV